VGSHATAGDDEVKNADRPGDSDREAMNRIIMEELIAGIVRPESAALLQTAIARLKEAGCDAVVLGCTELPLAVRRVARNVGLPRRRSAPS
jgi:aspartate/glutamate racemase